MELDAMLDIRAKKNAALQGYTPCKAAHTPLRFELRVVISLALAFAQRF